MVTAKSASSLARALIGLAGFGILGTAGAHDAVAGEGRGHGVAVHYRDGHGGYGPPVNHHRRFREPVFVLPPPPIVYVPSRAHGYWHHDVDPWGHPIRSWVPAPRHYAPPPHPYDHHPRPRQRYGSHW